MMTEETRTADGGKEIAWRWTLVSEMVMRGGIGMRERLGIFAVEGPQKPRNWKTRMRASWIPG